MNTHFDIEADAANGAKASKHIYVDKPNDQYVINFTIARKLSESNIKLFSCIFSSNQLEAMIAGLDAVLCEMRGEDPHEDEDEDEPYDDDDEAEVDDSEMVRIVGNLSGKVYAYVPDEITAGAIHDAMIHEGYGVYMERA